MNTYENDHPARMARPERGTRARELSVSADTYLPPCRGIQGPQNEHLQKNTRGPLWGAQKSTNKMSFCALTKSGAFCLRSQYQFPAPLRPATPAFIRRLPGGILLKCTCEPGGDAP